MHEQVKENESAQRMSDNGDLAIEVGISGEEHIQQSIELTAHAAYYPLTIDRTCVEEHVQNGGVGVLAQLGNAR